MRRALALLFVLAAYVFDPISVCAQAQIPNVPGWSLLWHDEFDGSQVDSSNWELLTRQNSYNNEKQYYLPSQAAIVGGNLRITASNQPIADKQ